jgi:hypothetical protein
MKMKSKLGKECRRSMEKKIVKQGRTKDKDN